LVEVVIAIGIVGFAILAMFGLFGTVLSNSRGNADRRVLLESVDSLHSYLNEEKDFASVYEWAKSGTDLFYVTYKSDTNGSPDAEATEVRSLWFDDVTDAQQYSAAQNGPWVKAHLKLATSNNPGGITALPDLLDFSGSYLVLLVSLQTVSDPSQVSTNSVPLWIPVVVRR
jgi:hypothetical protein